LTLSTGGQLVFTGGQTFLAELLYQKKLSSRCSKQVGKIILTAGQSAW